ncbi:cache domain-containing protein [Halarcobacter sp.]|uniref:sensor histidine kinase n=1 Tax=Halarcobacter sp. TaxID=2321133 RepID=UPI0029F5353F|nr:cache domain-containing protein [Halarcobacter sp.]
MKNSNERIILLIIKYTPPFFIILLSIVITFILFQNTKNVFFKEKEITQNQFINNNKDKIKTDVNHLYEFIRKEQALTEKTLKENLKERVNEAYSIAMNIYNENKHLGKEKVKKLIKDALRKIRFNNGRGYYFIYSFDYECILLPINKSLEGKNFYNYQDSKGLFLTREIVNRIQNQNEVFLTWWYHKPNDMQKQYKKLGFNKHFEPYNWFIGTGEYFNDFEDDVKKNVIKYIKNYNFTNSEYFFVLNYDGKYLNHADEELIGTNAFEVGNTKPEDIEKIIDAGKNNSSNFVSYVQLRKPNTDMSAKKTSYVKGIDNWQWIIGKGFYENEVNEIIKKEEKLINQRLRDNLKQLILFTIVLTIILLLISFYMSKFLKKKFRNYQRQIEKKQNELVRQQEMLAQQSKLAAIGTMIGNIAHQWRQPLSLISTIATGTKLKKEMGSLEDKELIDGLDNINQTTQYLSKTIDDFRNFFNTNKVKKEFSVEEAFNNCFNLINVQFKNHNIDIIKNINDSIIYGIQTELVQVLINLLNNSRDELLKLENQKKLIFIDTKEKNDELIIQIKDNAGGIDEKIIKHLFEPYFTTKHQSQGTGIGLYMSEEIIVKHMRGTITIENTEFTYENIHYKGALATIKLKLHN